MNDSDWTCPAGCDEPKWAHELYGDYDPVTRVETLTCPPPPAPRDCCGRLQNTTEDEIRACSNGGCSAWWCACGVFTGMSTGPVLCGCEYDRGEVPLDVPTMRSGEDDGSGN